jgi:hypothetical protein
VLNPSPTQMQNNWQPTHSYALGAIIVPTVANNLTYVCIAPGTSGSTEPTWPTDGGGTVVDSGVTWQTSNGTILHPWQPSHAYTVGTAMQPTVGNGFTYVCTAPGTSGTTEPTWPTSAGTVGDGGVTWAFGTTVAMQMSRAISVVGGSTASFGTALYAVGPFYDAILEFSGATLADAGVKDAAIRLAANQPIDWSGDLTDAHQNVRTTRYNSSKAAWQYITGSITALSISDTGVTDFSSTPTVLGGHWHRHQSQHDQPRHYRRPDHRNRHAVGAVECGHGVRHRRRQYGVDGWHAIGQRWSTIRQGGRLARRQLSQPHPGDTGWQDDPRQQHGRDGGTNGSADWHRPVVQ